MLKRNLPEKPKKKIILVLGIVLVIAAVGISQPILWPGGWGVGKEQSVTTRSVETVVKDAQGNTTKTVETTKNDDGKTLWDWLSLLGVPVSLAVLGYVLQQLQQKRSDTLAKEQREIAADETKEEVLQVYFDRLSMLLVDKNLLAIAAKGDQATDEEQQLLDSSKDVIRARTLSILRRFENDPERKTSVMRFLIEAHVIRRLNLYLSGADLSGVDLSSGADLCNAKLMKTNLSNANLSNASCMKADLSSANLMEAKLMKADLSSTNLISANLSYADFSNANLSHADFMNANLSYADLSNADLSNADLSNTNLSHTDLSHANNLTVGQLQSAKFCHTKLPQNITRDPICPDPNRDCETLGFSENQFA